jgi:predicted nucleic acid-binding protein
MPTWPASWARGDGERVGLGRDGLARVSLEGRAARMLVIARVQDLSSYDATDLELAQRLGASLASFDRRLHEAAQRLDLALAP